MSAPIRILVVNPGSTSTKLGLFENEKPVATGKVDHAAKDLEAYPRILDQVPMRRQVMLDFLEQQGLAPTDLSAVVGRGGLLKPMVGGTYTVSAKMAEDLKNCTYGEHASNIGGVLAYSFHEEFNVPAFIVDPAYIGPDRRARPRSCDDAQTEWVREAATLAHPPALRLVSDADQPGEPAPASMLQMFYERIQALEQERLGEPS